MFSRNPGTNGSHAQSPSRANSGSSATSATSDTRKHAVAMQLQEDVVSGVDHLLGKLKKDLIEYLDVRFERQEVSINRLTKDPNVAMAASIQSSGSMCSATGSNDSSQWRRQQFLSQDSEHKDQKDRITAMSAVSAVSSVSDGRDTRERVTTFLVERKMQGKLQQENDSDMTPTLTPRNSKPSGDLPSSCLSKSTPRTINEDEEHATAGEDTYGSDISAQHTMFGGAQTTDVSDQNCRGSGAAVRDNSKSVIQKRFPEYSWFQNAAPRIFSSSQRGKSRSSESLQTDVLTPRLDQRTTGGNKSLSKISTMTDMFQRHRSIAATKQQTSRPYCLDGLDDAHGPEPCLIRFAKSQGFDVTFAILILTNAMFIGLQVEYQAYALTQDAPIYFQVVQIAYCAVFVFELIVRMSSKGCRQFFREGDWAWNFFDFVMVFISLIEVIVHIATSWIARGQREGLRNVSILRMVRVIRVVRVLRVIRLIRFFRSLRVLVHAIFHTLRSCVWALALLFLILYVFAVMFVQACADIQINSQADDFDGEMYSDHLVSYFGTVEDATFTLFKSINGGMSWDVLVSPLIELGMMYLGLFLLYFSFVFFAVMNVVTGLFCQSAIESAQRDQEDVIEEKLKNKEIYIQKCHELFGAIDKEGNNCIYFEDFERNLQDSKVEGFFHSMDIHATDAWMLFSLMDQDMVGVVNLHDFIVGCLRLRGTATGVHIAQIQQETKWMMRKIGRMERLLEDAKREVESMVQTTKPAISRSPKNASATRKQVQVCTEGKISL